MKRLRFIPALLLILSACSENIVQGPERPGEMGAVSIALETDLRSETVATKASEEPNPDDFRIAIYKVENQMRLYNDSYANTSGKEIKLNAGEYRLVAQHGDTLGCGFNKPYYLADPTFTVEGRNTQVSAVAKLANVKLAVEYDMTITEVYPDYYAVVKHKTYTKKKVKFVKGETRSGYIPGGDLTLQVWVSDAGVWKVYETEPAAYNPNDFVTFSVTTSATEGNLLVNIKVDTSAEGVDKSYEIDAEAKPQNAPVITLGGFDGEDNVLEFIEGVNKTGNGMASFIARGSLTNCYLTVNSSYLAAKGVPAEVDFANLTADQKASLSSAGISWDEGMLGSRKLSYINFTGMIAEMAEVTKAEADDVVMAEFTLKIVDAAGKTSETSFKIVSGTVNSTVDIRDYNIWARRIESPVVTADKGNMALIGLQYSLDRSNWTTVQQKPAQEGYVLTYGTIAVDPGLTYYVRAIYNGNENCVSPTVQVRTEDAAQLGNSGFEDYQLVQTKFTPMGGIIGGGSYTRNWYLPYASGEPDPWWACNSMKSMHDGHTGWTSTWSKNFPSSGYTKDSRSGSRAALLYCVNVGNGNTDLTAVGTTYEGEIWTGTADGSGNIADQGHAFPSRPAKLTFYYKYTENDTRFFFVDTWIQDASGNTIAAAQETAGPAASDWTRYELAYDYATLEAKAAKIFVRISSCFEDGYVKTKREFSLGEETVNAHAGCFLTLDDMELIYE